MLFVAPRYLLPADSGGKIRTGHVLRGLKGGAFQVTLVSPAPPGAAERDSGELVQLCDRFASWPETERGRYFNIARLRHLVSRLPISVASDFSAAGGALIASELRGRPDVMVVDFPHTAILIPPVCDTKTVLFTHNVEAEIFSRHFGVASNLVRQAIWRNQWKKMRRFERETLSKFDAIIAVSDRDRMQFKKAYGVDAAVIPTGVDLDFFAYCPPVCDTENLNIVFTASMDYHPNIDAIRWFMDECWPDIARAEPRATVMVVGRNPDPRLLRTAADRKLPWTFTGFVEDVRPYVGNATVYIIPLRIGGGTRIKAYEAMAMGRPVVSTSIGLEGLPVEADRHYLPGDSPQAFAQSVLRLLRDPALQARIAANARHLVETQFSASVVARAFERICLEALDDHHVRPQPDQSDFVY
jgi:glycosyltransferase involved in cell wall biosynthesis